MYAAYEIQRQAIGIEDYSDSNLNNLVFQSGMGVPISKLYSNDSFEDRLTEFARLSGLEKVPHMNPVALEYYAGSPALSSPDDLSWNEETFEKGLFGSAIGMTLLREAQEAKQLLSNSPKEIAENPTKSFNALLLLESVRQKVYYIKETHAMTKEQLGRSYIPHEVSISQNNSKLHYRVSNSSSLLLDRVSILWGLVRTVDLIGQEKAKSLLEKNDLFSNVSIEGVKSLIDDEINFLLESHLDPELGVLVDSWSPERPSGEKQVSISAKNIGLLIPCLSDYIDLFGGETEKGQRVRKIIANQTDFLLDNFRVNGEGFRDSYNKSVEDEVIARRSLGSQLAAIRALIESHELLGNERYLSAAKSTFQYLLDEYWNRPIDACSDLELFDESFSSNINPCYSPLDIGLAIGALEELAANSTPIKAEEIRNYLGIFTNNLLDRANMQLPDNMWNYWSEEPLERFYSRVFARRVCIYQED